MPDNVCVSSGSPSDKMRVPNKSATCIAALLLALPPMLEASEQAAPSIERGPLNSATPDTAAELHAQAIKEARSGNPQAALGLLRQLRQQFPDNQQFAFDLIAVANWAGQDDEAMALASTLNLADAPLYVVESAARAARNLGRKEQAMGLYAIVARRAPDRLDGFLGQANVLIDRGQPGEALAILDPLRSRFDRRFELWDALARAYEAKQEWLPMLDAAQRLLALAPTHPVGLRSQATALRRLGAPHEVVRETPDTVLSADEKAALQRDQIAFEIRWARVAAEEATPERWAHLDRTIAAAQALEKELAAQGRTRDVELLQQDILQALVDRRRMAEGIQVYEKLAAQGPQPPYVRLAAAAAYLQLRRPDEAYALYASVLPSGEAEMNDRLGFFYSMLESERYGEAIAYIDHLSASTPEWLGERDAAIRRPNPDYPRVQVNAALARSYTERLGEGQSRLDDLGLRAPADGGIVDARAATYRLRGWPRRAEELANWQLARTPEDGWLRLGLFASGMALGDYPQAERDLKEARRRLPEAAQTAGAERDWQTHQLREFRFEAESGIDRGAASVIGAREHRLDAWLYSAPIDYRWRIFGHTQEAAAAFDPGRVRRTSVGVGTEYRQRGLSATAEVFSPGNRPTGVAANATFALDDHWRIDAGAERHTLQAPLRAYRDGVDADREHVSVTYRWHESRSASIGAERLPFSDTNRRQALSANWIERLVSGPIYLLDARLEYYTSRNSLPASAVSYFNPSRDQAVQLTFANEWTQFHRYERSLKHRLAVGFGNYWQEGFGSGSIEQLRYEAAWSPDDRSEFRLGTSYLRRPYDGAKSRMNSIFLIGNWRF